jgi:hypothetical protein
MNKRLAAIGTAIVLGLGLAACSPAEPVSGTIKGKYVEDFTEPTLVMTGDDGNEHHFTVEWDQYRRVAVGQRFSSADLEQPADD